MASTVFTSFYKITDNMDSHGYNLSILFSFALFVTIYFIKSSSFDSENNIEYFYALLKIL